MCIARTRYPSLSEAVHVSTDWFTLIIRNSLIRKSSRRLESDSDIMDMLWNITKLRMNGVSRLFIYH